MKFNILILLVWANLTIATFAQQANAHRVYGDEQAAGPNGTFLSDHFTVDTGNPINQQGLWVASSNSTGRGSPNGYKAKDTYADGRMQQNTNRFIQYLSTHPNAFFGFQEWNDVDISRLKAAFAQLNQSTRNNFDLRFTKTIGTSFNHGLLYNQNLYQFQSESANDVPELNNLNAYHPTNKTPQGNQANRYLHVTLQNRQTGEIYHVIVVHLRWYIDPQNIINGLQALFNRLPNCIIMGDFNSDITAPPLQNATKLISQNGFISGSPNNYSYETTDAILFNLNNQAGAQNVRRLQPLPKTLPPLASVAPALSLSSSSSAPKESWGDSASFDDFLEEHVIGYEQNRVRQLYGQGAMSKDDVLQLGALQKSYIDGIQGRMAQPQARTSSIRPSVPPSVARSPSITPTPLAPALARPMAPSGAPTPSLKSTPRAPALARSMAPSGAPTPSLTSTPRAPALARSMTQLPSSAPNESWGKYASFDELLKYGITGRLWDEIRSAYTGGLITANDITTLSNIDFKVQPAAWLQMKKDKNIR